MSVAVGVVLASTRPEPTEKLLRTLLSCPEPPAAVSVVFQGSPQAGRSMHALCAHLNQVHGRAVIYCTYDAGRGLSRARNIALRHLPDDVEWVWTPNDTSHPPSDFTTIVNSHIVHADPAISALAMDYRVGSQIRRRVSDLAYLEEWSLWRALEPAILWRYRALIEIGGFDERLGTGSFGWAQSGEGTDVLAKQAARGYRIGTLPLSVTGTSQHRDLASRDRILKEFYYGVGFGVVARRHFPISRGALTALAPMVRFSTRRSVEGSRLTLGLAVAALCGRMTGLIGGNAMLSIRRRGRLWS